MGLPAKLVRAQLNFFKPFVENRSLLVTRLGQDKLGELMETLHRKDVIVREHNFGRFEGAWILPKDELRQGVVLYLHGGGYTCGDLEYAKGFGSTLSDECGMRVFCGAYRLAPENPYPAALEDALECYNYILSKGYAAKQIVLCGESAGGGLIYALCLRLKELGLPLPAGLIAISPWTDLTLSGQSHEDNREVDPSLTRDLLQFYADCYAQDKSDPLVSPLFGDLTGFPPSLLFVGADELLLDDTRMLHAKLTDSGCKSSIIVAPERWHAYVLYHLNENMSDFDTINEFLNSAISKQKKLRWMRLDNAGKIYPASLRKGWSNIFRISANLTEPVDTEILHSALDVTVRRFPSIAVRLRRGFFWYYFEQIPAAPPILQERCYPLVHMPLDDIHKCAFRVIAYKERIALEVFHAVTDGTGGLIFFKTLLAEYLSQKYGETISSGCGVLGRLEEPSEAELEDSFQKYAGKVNASRRESTAYRITGTKEPDGYLNVTTFTVRSEQLHAAAKARGVSITEYLCAVMMKAILELQGEKERGRKMPVKVLIPANLRKLFPSNTLRNFSLFATPEIDPRLGDYTLGEICTVVHHFLKLTFTPKIMSTKIARNVNTERAAVIKLLPLGIKNLAMKLVFDTMTERQSCLCLSNLGVVQMPQMMRQYVTRMDLIISTQVRSPYSCGVVSWGEVTNINFNRKIREPELESRFHNVLRSEGIHVRVESNQR